MGLNIPPVRRMTDEELEEKGQALRNLRPTTDDNERLRFAYQGEMYRRAKANGEKLPSTFQANKPITKVVFTKGDQETLTCMVCRNHFTRKVVKGRKPKLCPTCKGE